VRVGQRDGKKMPARRRLTRKQKITKATIRLLAAETRKNNLGNKRTDAGPETLLKKLGQEKSIRSLGKWKNKSKKRIQKESVGKGRS